MGCYEDAQQPNLFLDPFSGPSVKVQTHGLEILLGQSWHVDHTGMGVGQEMPEESRWLTKG